MNDADLADHLILGLSIALLLTLSALAVGAAVFV